MTGNIYIYICICVCVSSMCPISVCLTMTTTVSVDRVYLYWFELCLRIARGLPSARFNPNANRTGVFQFYSFGTFSFRSIFIYLVGGWAHHNHNDSSKCSSHLWFASFAMRKCVRLSMWLLVLLFADACKPT